MTKEEAINKVLKLAESEIGYHEKASNARLDDKFANAGSGNYTKYARDLDGMTDFYNGAKNGYAWCDVFVDWLFYHTFGASIAMKMLCQPQKSMGAGCLYSAGYYKQAGRWTSIPARGNQIFFSYSSGEVSHTGIVESVSAQQVVTIEGNTSDQVARRTYSINDKRIYGYGIPRWEYASSSASPTVAENEPVTSTTTTMNTNQILRYGDMSEAVQTLQKNLIKLGYDCGTAGADGEFGKATLKAVKQFQEDNGLTVDGEAGPDTLSLINQKLGKQTPTKPVSTPTETTPTDEKTYVVKPGDTLWGIAASQLGRGFRYLEIKKLNNLKSNILQVGQVLKLP